MEVDRLGSDVGEGQGLDVFGWIMAEAWLLLLPVRGESSLQMSSDCCGAGQFQFEIPAEMLQGMMGGWSSVDMAAHGAE